jgi:hypothetical protein
MKKMIMMILGMLMIGSLMLMTKELKSQITIKMTIVDEGEYPQIILKTTIQKVEDNLMSINTVTEDDKSEMSSNKSLMDLILKIDSDAPT